MLFLGQKSRLKTILKTQCIHLDFPDKLSYARKENNSIKQRDEKELHLWSE